MTATLRAPGENGGVGFVGTVARLAAETPADRNRVVDALRAGSILVVVFGHWLMAAITVEGGKLVPNHLLELAPQTHLLTWVLQVMPIFFFVGGYSNALSWRSARRRGVGYGGWLRSRLRRLALPVIPVLLFWTAFGWLALRLGLDWEVLQLASQVALVPTWFLAAYVVIVTIAPPLLALWDRIGLWSVVAGLALAGLCDLLSVAGGVIAVGFLNYVFVWGTVHQLGYAWLDGKLDGMAKRIGLLVVGFLATLSLVWAGPYPVAMVGLDTAEVTNSYPPRVTLAFLGLFQVGLVLLLEGPLRRWLEWPRVWPIVVGVNLQIMTLYLWHLTAMVLVIGFSLVIGGLGLGLEPLSKGWWLTRPIWFAVLGVVTIALIAIFGKFERPAPDLRPSPPAWQPVFAVLSICAGLGLLAAIGIADEAGLNGLVLSLPVIGVILGGVVRMPGRVATTG